MDGRGRDPTPEGLAGEARGMALQARWERRESATTIDATKIYIDEKAVTCRELDSKRTQSCMTHCQCHLESQC